MGRVIVNFFLLTFVICAAIAYDVSVHGSLESSITGRYLKQAGLLIYVKPYYSIVEEQTLLAFKWGKKNFPYKEYDALKNKTAELSKNVGNHILYFSREGFATAKTLSINSYNWVADRVPPDFSEQVFEFLSKIYQVLCTYSKKTLEFLTYNAKNTQKWFAENVTREKVTWENVEKSFFELAQTCKIYYSHVSRWVGRKIECLMSA